MVYLVAKFAKDDSIYPKELEQQAIIQQRMYFDAHTMFRRFQEAMVSFSYFALPVNFSYVALPPIPRLISSLNKVDNIRSISKAIIDVYRM